MYEFENFDSITSQKINIGIYAVIFLLVALFVAWGISTLISWEGGKDRSYVKRRWVCGIVWAVVWISFFFFALSFAPQPDSNGVEDPDAPEYAQFMQMCTGLIALLYPVLLFVLAWLTPNSKLGSILHLKK